jgi:oxygen-independent coproporphyrinogen III oxidase
MAGLYIHVPFCRQACRYCDFYFTVSLKYRDEYISALLKELAQRSKQPGAGEMSTIYLGGGTPSVLSKEQLQKIMKQIHHDYSVMESAEITIEANPDDLTIEYLHFLKNTGFNRLSVGVQSFHAKDLDLMRRSHNEKQARECLEQAYNVGFNNISMDLIYGLPGLSLSGWEENLRITMEQPVTHISAYHLTYEPDTVFNHWKKMGRIAELPEQTSIDMYYALRKISGTKGFEHYEISNFAREGFRSRHNSNYWTGKHYLGFGPSAHSFNGKERLWNVSSLKQYLDKMERGVDVFELEVLSPRDKYHDYLLTSLRTAEGAELGLIKKYFGVTFEQDLMGKSQIFIKRGELVLKNGVLRMTPEGWLKSDLIIEKLMLS